MVDNVAKNLIFGDSQTICLRDALRQDATFRSFFKVSFVGAGRTALNIFPDDSERKVPKNLANRFRTILKQTENYETLVCSLGAGEHAQLWNFNGNGEEFGSSSSSLKTAAVRQYFTEVFSQRTSFLKMIKTHNPGKKLLFISSPPPPGSNEFCTELRIKRHKENGQDINCAPSSLTSPETRLKSWDIMESVNASLCDLLEFVYLPAPKEALESDGFLKEKYWEDWFHGNREYGDLRIKSIFAALNES